MYRIAVALARDGHTPRQISERLGVSYHAAQSLLRFARRRGMDTRPHISTALLTQTTPEVRAWLDRQTPAGATVGDVILAIITDAYHEESEKC